MQLLVIMALDKSAALYKTWRATCVRTCYNLFINSFINEFMKNSLYKWHTLCLRMNFVFLYASARAYVLANVTSTKEIKLEYKSIRCILQNNPETHNIVNHNIIRDMTYDIIILY